MITTEVITSKDIWKDFGQQIFEIEKSVFQDQAFSEEYLKKDLSDPKLILAVLKDGDSIIGFVYALPTNSDPENTAGIVDIAIKKEHQGKGLVAPLMSCIEKELKNNGYEYFIEHAMVDNGYADKIDKNYASRIIERNDFIGEYGKQRFFKIKL